jgi:hypothetical protein
MVSSIIRLSVFLSLFHPLFLLGQLQRGSADFAGPTSYQIDNAPDSVYVFFAENPDKFIEAHSPDGDTVSLEWAVYNPLNGQYEIFLTENALSSQIGVTHDRGYRLVISEAGTNDTMRCWVVIDDFSVRINSIDSVLEDGIWKNTIPEVNKWCHLITNIRASIDSADMAYYHPESGDPVEIPCSYPISRQNWSASPEPTETGINYFFQNDNYFLTVNVQNPNWEDSWYKLTIQDQFGLVRSDSIFNESIEPHAEFEYRYIKLDDSIYYPERYDKYYEYYDESSYVDTSAPALFLFKNLAVNADTMVWYFGDGQSSGTNLDSVIHTYELPGNYEPFLVVYSSPEHLYDACTDTFPNDYDLNHEVIEYPITISKASILSDSNDSTLLPNVFSCPNGEPNYFRFLNDVSLTAFEIVIFNRYGKRVYHFSGNIRDWEGWDGRDKSSDNYVQTGVYYYVVKELQVLPDYETGKKVRLEYYFPSKVLNEKDKKEGVQSIYQGFVHVYNNE